ncbi:MAG: hypothetical protein POELPBGB_00289 [Bacteroidia bacterium]|nr:hypothetical protein [Bacteroidia bacterium]
MKKLLYLLFVFISASAYAQSPNTINYQAVLRSSGGEAYVPQSGNIDLTFEIYISESAGTPVWSQIVSDVDVSQYGVVNTEFGDGDLASLDWAGIAYWLEVTAEGNIDLGRKQLNTVPYAFHAKTSDTAAYALQSNVSAPILTLSGQTLGIQGSNTVTLPADTDTDTDEQNLTVSGNTLSLTNSTPASVTLTFTVTGNQVALNGTNVFTIPDLTPPGTIVAYGGDANNIPTGWLLCDGQAYPRTGEYAPLFATIATQFGFPNGNEFNVPDLRGMFLRGQSGTRSDAYADPGRTTRIASGLNGATGNTVGSLQVDALQGHAHKVYGGDVNGGGTRNALVRTQLGQSGNGYADVQHGGADEMVISAYSNQWGTPRVATETRPTNVYVNYIIKK